MGLVQGIQRIAQGDVAGGLMDTVGMGSLYDLTRGNKSGGEFAKELGINAGVTLATAGVGAAAGAAASGLAKAAAGAAQAGTKIGLIGSKVATVASKGLSAVSKVMNPGQYTGGPAGVEKVQSGIPEAAKTGISGTLPGNTIKYQSHSLPVTEVGKFTKAQMIGTKVNTQLRAKASNIKTNVGKITGQGVIQGALSVGLAIMGAKQANAANEVSKQSLLFQKQTYNEQQAEIEKNKAKLKQDAWSDYSSASLFGSQLYGSESNNTLLTNYHTNNGTGNQGSFSLLNASISTSKRTDLT